MMNRVAPKVIAEKCGISDRRVRELCKDGKIYGMKKNGNRYLIPENAIKPTDFRSYRNLKISQSNLGILARLDAYRDEVDRQIQTWDREPLFFLEMMTEQFAKDLYWQHLGFERVAYIKRNQIHPKNWVGANQPECAKAAKYICESAYQEPKLTKTIVKAAGCFFEEPWRKGGKEQIELDKEWDAIYKEISPFILRQKRSREHPIEKAVIFYFQLVRSQVFPKNREVVTSRLLNFILLQAGYPVVTPTIFLSHEYETIFTECKKEKNETPMIHYIANHLEDKLEKLLYDLKNS